MKLRNIVYVLFLILLTESVFAIGISPGNIVLHFEPGLSRTIEYSIVNTMPFELGASISFGGSLDKYMNISQTYIESLEPNEVKTVTLTINLPESIEEPGKHRHIFSAVEQRRVEGEVSGMVARGGVIDYLDIWVLYPTKYPVAEFSASDASTNDTARMSVRLWNYGKPNISVVSGYVEILDLDSKVIDTVTLNPVYNIPSFEFEELVGFWNTLDVIPSIYHARAVVNADGQKLTTELDKFKIGELELKILSHTQSVFAGQLEEFELFVENKWNHEVANVFAEVTVKKDGEVVAEFRTLNYDFVAWEKKAMKGFFNTAGLEAGTHEVEIEIYYLDRTSFKTLSIEVVKKPFPTSLVLMIAANVIIVILVIIIAFILLTRKAKSSRKKV